MSETPKSSAGLNEDAQPSLSVVEPVAPEGPPGPGEPLQTEMPFAVVAGEPVTQLPRDLYIPPYALKVFLEAFEGPLDLLLYLIKKQNLDILNIPIAEITRQYTQYIELMQDMQLELAGDYLVMAAMLAEIKSRMLLPRPVDEDADEEDPRAELVRRLQLYERYKQAAVDIDALPRMERDVQPAKAEYVADNVVELLPQIHLPDVLNALQDVLRRAEMYRHHEVRTEALSVRERMGDVLSMVGHGSYTDFGACFDPKEGRMGVVVTFLAILELVKESLIELTQDEPYAPIHVRAAEGVAAKDQPSAEPGSDAEAAESDTP